MIGSGVLNGMAVTLRNFIGSYFERDRLTTVQYPEEREALPENYRNFPFLVYDTDDAEVGLRCVACKICEKECPPQSSAPSITNPVNMIAVSRLHNLPEKTGSGKSPTLLIRILSETSAMPSL